MNEGDGEEKSGATGEAVLRFAFGVADGEEACPLPKSDAEASDGAADKGFFPTRTDDTEYAVGDLMRFGCAELVEIT